MAKLADDQMNLLKLISRTPAKEDGWRSVSETCCPLFTRADFPSSTTSAELFEFEKLEDGGRVRLTDRGEIVLFYS